MTVYVMTHKFINTSLPDNYKLMLLGAYKRDKIPSNYVTDDKGDNISSKNSSYCELTGLYELWKNYTDKNLGLVHYRRFFTHKNYYSRFIMYLIILIFGKAKLSPIDESNLDNYLKDYDWIVPTRELEAGMTLWDHYSKYHFEKDLILTEKVINNKYPEYKEAFKQVLHRQNKMSPFNMFYTSKEQMDSYCEWIFSVLSDIESVTDISNYDKFKRRIYGFLAEELFNVWLYKHSELRIKYLSVYNTHLISRKQILSRISNRGRII